MLVTRYNPFKELRELESRLFNYYPSAQSEEGDISAFRPSVSTREGEFAYHIEVDLPGVKKEDIHIDLKENQIIISGERSFKEERKENDYYKVEVSGMASVGDESPRTRLQKKVDQALKGQLARPGMAVVVRFADMRILSEGWR